MQGQGIAFYSIVGFALLVVGYLVLLLLRRSWLNSTGALFDCGLRVVGAKTRIWRIGLARYSKDSLLWYQIWRIRLFPKHTIPRRAARLLATRAASEGEARVIFSGSADVFTIEVNGGATYELVLNRGSAMGLMSWLEAAPPSQFGYHDEYVD